MSQIVKPADALFDPNAEWRKEWDFWNDRLDRAYIRLEAAEERGDFAAQEKAHGQIKLYRHHADKVMPKEVKDHLDARRAEKVRLAMEEE